MTATLSTMIDSQAVRSRMDAYWRGELAGRPAIAIEVPRAGTAPAEKPPYASGHDGDDSAVVEQLERYLDTHEFLGEAVPYYYVEFAADHFATLLGTDLTFAEGQKGGWPVHWVTDWDEADIRFRPEGKWWQRTVEQVTAIQDKLGDRVMIASNTFVANLDAMVAMRGANDLLMDLIECPEKVHRALERVTEAYRDIRDAWSDLLDWPARGSINRHGLYCSGLVNVPQCDFSCMIGPEMFAEFVLPYLQREMQMLDGVEYHLDGPDAIRHLDALCSLPEVDLIQWIAGAGEAGTQDWSELFLRIDALGKGQFRGGTPQTVREWMPRLKSPKVFWSMKLPSRDEAEDFLGEWEA